MIVVSKLDIEFVTNLVVVPMLDFDVIFVMDWISIHGVINDYFTKIVLFQVTRQGSIIVVPHGGNTFAKS